MLKTIMITLASWAKIAAFVLAIPVVPVIILGVAT